MRTARRLTLAALSLALVAVLCGSVARADPDGSGSGSGSGSGGSAIPGQNQIDQAKAAVRARQATADRLQSDLAAADRGLHALETRAGLAAEAYDAAVERSARARRAAAEALAQADDARHAQEAADARLGTLAASMYRQGPDLTRLAGLIHLSTLREFTDREQVIRKLSATEAAAVRDARSTAQAAATAQQQAQAAATAQQAAEQQARAARDAAQAAATAERAQLAELEARREATLAELARAQGVEVALERQRQQALAEQAARQAAAARAAAARAAAATAAGANRSPKTGRSPNAAGPIPYAAGPARALLAYVYAQLGKPYVWGGAGPDVFDCSGLAMRGLEAAGQSFPHPAQWQYLAMNPVPYADLRPGDLVFWAENPADPHTIYHEAIALGGDRIIQAPRPGGVVEVQSLWVNGAPSFYARP